MTILDTPSGPYRLLSVTYKVESASTPGHLYAVSVTDDGWTCSCKASQYTKTRGKCWHLKAARDGQVIGKPTVRLTSVPR